MALDRHRAPSDSSNPPGQQQQQQQRGRFQQLRFDDLGDLPSLLQDPGLHPALRPVDSSSAVREPRTSLTSRRTGLRRPKSVLDHSRSSLLKRQQEDARRDSGLASSFVTMLSSDSKPPSSDTPSSSHVPSIVVQDDSSAASKKRWNVLGSTKSRPSDTASPPRGNSVSAAHDPPNAFEGITTDIPTGAFDDPFSSEKLSFSNRGSVLWSGQKAKNIFPRSTSTKSFLNPTTAVPPVHHEVPERAVSADDTRLSEKVRFMYEHGDENAANWAGAGSLGTEVENRDSVNDVVGDLPNFSNTPMLSSPSSVHRSPSSASKQRPRSYIQKEPTELAGGMEDWRDVNSADIDRYGFIRQPKRISSGSSVLSSPKNGNQVSSPGSRPAIILPVAEMPNGPTQTPPKPAGSSQRRSFLNGSPNRPISGSSAGRRAPSILSTRSRASRISTTANKGRKWANEAGDMMTLQLGLAIFPTHTEDTDSPSKAALERKREGKWASMARSSRQVASSATGNRNSIQIGSGASFTFDTTSDKLISRTWKGIPDRWRSPAWYAFLTASAKRQQGRAFVADETLVAQFYGYQEQVCVDDVQIDMDVPRTIGGHIMFRRRYRGGQRLLFRLLRALSLHFPAIGYVQGMASIAATLLCYYDEEKAFVMAVRLWECRGVAHLYGDEFAGLMEVLDEFKQRWLSRLPVNRSLDEWGVGSTSFGTKWYLTLFGYSIPFAAQLRVWDVFMLLGEPITVGGETKAGRANYEILHCVAAALLDGLQEVLLDADFENAMKVLTQPVPVGREDVLMRIAQKEYKVYQKARK